MHSNSFFPSIFFMTISQNKPNHFYIQWLRFVFFSLTCIFDQSFFFHSIRILFIWSLDFKVANIKWKFLFCWKFHFCMTFLFVEQYFFLLQRHQRTVPFFFLYILLNHISYYDHRMFFFFLLPFIFKIIFGFRSLYLQSTFFFFKSSYRF